MQFNTETQRHREYQMLKSREIQNSLLNCKIKSLLFIDHYY
jgi:hypothetical protein